MFHSHITSPLLHNSNKPFLSPSARTFLSSATPHIPWTSPGQFLLLLSQLPRNHHLHSPYPPNNRNLSPFPPLHTSPPPVLLIHQLASCIFHTQNLSPTSKSPSLLSRIFHGSISYISHTTLNLPLLASHKYHMDLPYSQTLHLLPHSLPLLSSEVHLQPLAFECLLPFSELLPQSLHRLTHQNQVICIQHLTHQTISHTICNHVNHDCKNQRLQHGSLVESNFHLKLLGQL